MGFCRSEKQGGSVVGFANYWATALKKEQKSRILFVLQVYLLFTSKGLFCCLSL